MFIDAKDKVIRKNGESYLTQENIREIVEAYNSDIPIDGFSNIIDLADIKKAGNMLSISMYVKKSNESNHDLDGSISEYIEAIDKVHGSMDELIKLFE